MHALHDRVSWRFAPRPWNGFPSGVTILLPTISEAPALAPSGASEPAPPVEAPPEPAFPPLAELTPPLLVPPFALEAPPSDDVVPLGADASGTTRTTDVPRALEPARASGPPSTKEDV